MGKIVNSVTDGLGLTDSGAAARGTAKGYAAMSEGQQQALDYLKKLNELPAELRTQGMSKMADIFGYGDPNAQQDYFSGLTEDPFYKMISEGGDEAVLRNQSAIGELRGGSSFSALAQNENKNRMATHNNNLEGINAFMGLPDYGSAIYGGMNDMATTKGQGIIDVAQAKQNAEQAGFNNLIGVGAAAAGLGWNPLAKAATTAVT